MRIATWNVNGLRARLDFILTWLAARQPDVVGLQELKVSDEEFPEGAFRELGFTAAVHGQKGWNGVGILSRLPMEPVQLGLPGQASFGARLIGARVAGLTFFTAYCPNGKALDHPDFERKLVWFDDLAAFWRGAGDAGDAAVLCGDFNVVPTAEDSWHGAAGDGRLFHTAAERQRLAALESLGLQDLYRDRHRDGQAFTWWDYRGGAFHRGQGLRIDFLLGTRRVAERVTDVRIDRDFRKKQRGLTASDHAPVIADLDWEATSSPPGGAAP